MRGDPRSEVKAEGRMEKLRDSSFSFAGDGDSFPLSSSFSSLLGLGRGISRVPEANVGVRFSFCDGDGAGSEAARGEAARGEGSAVGVGGTGAVTCAECRKKLRKVSPVRSTAGSAVWVILS